MKIRKIEREEIDQIELLWEELKLHHQDRTIDYAQHYLKTTFAKRRGELLAKDRVAIFIAEKDGNDIGFCVVSINRNQGEVDSLYIQPQQRKYGAGKALMMVGMEWLKGQGPECIRLQVGQGNEEALSFYEKLGFKTRATMMELF